MEDRPDKSALTDNYGKYKINLAAGSATFHYTMAGMEPQTVTRTLTAGVTSRQNVELTPVVPAPLELAPMEGGSDVARNVASTSQATPTPPVAETPPVSNRLSDAVSEMMEKWKKTNGTVA